jgi:hypothetical protein
MNVQYVNDSKGKPTGVFIPIQEWEKLKKEYHLPANKTDDDANDEYVEPTTAEIIAGLKEALAEVKLHQEGKIKLQSARDFLREL